MYKKILQFPRNPQIIIKKSAKNLIKNSRKQKEMGWEVLIFIRIFVYLRMIKEAQRSLVWVHQNTSSQKSYPWDRSFATILVCKSDYRDLTILKTNESEQGFSLNLRLFLVKARKNASKNDCGETLSKILHFSLTWIA